MPEYPYISITHGTEPGWTECTVCGNDFLVGCTGLQEFPELLLRHENFAAMICPSCFDLAFEKDLRFKKRLRKRVRRLRLTLKIFKAVLEVIESGDDIPIVSEEPVDGDRD